MGRGDGHGHGHGLQESFTAAMCPLLQEGTDSHPRPRPHERRQSAQVRVSDVHADVAGDDTQPPPWCPQL